MKQIKITIKPSKLQADINTRGDKAQLNIGGNVVYQPLDCSTTINEDINATITRNGEYHYGYNPLTSTGLGSVDLSVNIPPQYVPVPGEMGTQGYQGTQGFAGTPGEQGAQGFPGAQGVDGLPGPDGQQGVQGYPGTPGEQGAQGFPGTPGEQGIDGQPGPDGQPGTQGERGTQGYQGTQGLEGPQGPQGEPGPVDLEDYYTKEEIDASLNVIDTSINTLEDQFQQILDGEGEIIIHGTQGERGTQGYQGTQGEQGVQGFPGTPGVNGVDGQPGPDGQQGTQGYQGTQGEQGAQGLPGAPGVDGQPGIMGTQGYFGTQGYQGTQGEQGAQGFPGQPGPDGSSGPATILKALDEFPQDASAGDVVAIRTLVGPVWGYWTEDPENYFTFTIDTENEELQDAEETTILSFMNEGGGQYRYALYYDASGNLCYKIYGNDNIIVDSSSGSLFSTDAGPGALVITTYPSSVSVYTEDSSGNYIPYDYTLGGEGTMNFATYQYDGDTWNIIGGDGPDLTNYYTKTEIDSSLNAIDSSIQQLATDSSIFVKSYECTWIKVMTEAQYGQITPDASVFYVLL